MVRLNLRPDWLCVTGQAPDRVVDEDTGGTKWVQSRIGRFLGRAEALVDLPHANGFFASLRVFGAPGWRAHYDLRQIKARGLDGLNNPN